MSSIQKIIIRNKFLIALIMISCNGNSKINTSTSKEKVDGMVWINGGIFEMGANENDTYAEPHEKPKHSVKVDGFYMDETEVTNEEFEEFVNATGYITTAEKYVDWETLKKELPANTPKFHDSLLDCGSFVFMTKKSQNSWWDFKNGANWKNPQGKGSNIKGKEKHPVVHISYQDALAYCEWTGKRLPTEAEWEYAARGGKKNKIYFWGDLANNLSRNINIWTGNFPSKNSKEDGFEKSAPVKSFPPNEFGLYEISGNVWEWTSDWYNVEYYEECLKTGLINNPRGAQKAYDPNSRHGLSAHANVKVIRGGSFLCHSSYCANYRVSSRHPQGIEDTAEHIGFRTVLDEKK